MKSALLAGSVLSALVTGIGMSAFATGPAVPATTHEADSDGAAIYRRANCVGCHKWHGNGGGGYGGAALSLRKTQLDKDQIVQTVTCGRPGTGMPYFLRNTYSNDKSAPHPCNGLTMEELGDVKVAEANVYLRPPEIEAVAGYVIANIKGKGEPNYADCAAFFGESARACEIYKQGTKHALPMPSTTN